MSLEGCEVVVVVVWGTWEKSSNTPVASCGMNFIPGTYKIQSTILMSRGFLAGNTHTGKNYCIPTNLSLVKSHTFDSVLCTSISILRWKPSIWDPRNVFRNKAVQRYCIYFLIHDWLWLCYCGNRNQLLFHRPLFVTDYASCDMYALCNHLGS